MGIPFSAQQTNGRFSVIRTRTDPVSLKSDQNQGYFPFLGGNRQKWPKFGPVAGKRPPKPQKMGVKWVKGEKEEKRKREKGKQRKKEKGKKRKKEKRKKGKKKKREKKKKQKSKKAKKRKRKKEKKKKEKRE